MSLVMNSDVGNGQEQGSIEVGGELRGILLNEFEDLAVRVASIFVGCSEEPLETR